ncbi:MULTISPECIES: phosphopantetheine-binding protein [Actinosynnema]|uniref:phosphopantetheine-binding protein n=1 Tax=Actinosynnema TaxID=40566 RepID=UPI0020A42586|nr:phosphopantetheine-binding protein [Actinosynnema pretiosum]MCP2098873.1 Aryl carrier domain-containing protein [Actinosynnema pretiosum]
MSELTLDSVRADVAEHLFLEPGEVDDDADLVEAGLDSVRLLDLATRWRGLGAEVGFADLAERPTLSAWWGLLGASRG